jgi:hypothetical protein
LGQLLANYRMVFVGKDDVRFDIAYLPLKLTKKYSTFFI